MKVGEKQEERQSNLKKIATVKTLMMMDMTMVSGWNIIKAIGRR